MGSLRSLPLLCLLPAALAQITVYHAPNQVVFTASSASASAPPAAYTGPQAFDPVTLSPPAVPTPAALNSIPVNLQKSGTGGLGVTQDPAFLGFSVEMSVSNQVFGKNSTLIQVPFLNLMASLVARAGSVRIRMGGNSQESAALADTIGNGRVIAKNTTSTTNRATPNLEFTADLFYMLGNISAFVNIDWVVGLPWFITQPFDLRIIPLAQQMLGSHLMGLQAGNEPDLYVRHTHRTNPNYSPYDYQGELSDFLTQLSTSGLDPQGTAANLLIAPNTASGTTNDPPAGWTPDEIWATGIVDKFSGNLKYLAVERYPKSNCGAVFNDGEPILVPQDTFPYYLSHSGSVALMTEYLSSTAFAQTKGKRMLMMETNQASCGGLGGISDVFGAVLWTLDYGLQLAHSNFSGAYFHTGGESVFYNPFTAPPTNQSAFHQWSVGPIYYAALAMSEAIGKSGNAQVLDLTYVIAGTGQNVSDFTPVYGIYENGVPARVAAFNYIDDPSGASDTTFAITVSDSGTPASVQVKYLAGSSVSQKGGYTWANQTLGGFFESDGRLVGQENIQTLQCPGGVCNVKVPAPGFALVFLNSDAFSLTESGAATVTFATTARTQFHNTATVPASVLATSNGHDNSIDGKGSTSRGKVINGAVGAAHISGVLLATFAGLVLGARVLLR